MMTIKTENWLGEFVSTIGTGDAILGGSIDGFAGFSNVGDNVDVYYTIMDGLDKETGIGTLSSGKLIRKEIHATLVSGIYVKNCSPLNLSGDAQVYGTANSKFLSDVYAFMAVAEGNTELIENIQELQINGHPLTASFNLTADDVGARPNSWIPSADDVNAYSKAAADIKFLQSQSAEPSNGLLMRVGGIRDLEIDSEIKNVSTTFIGDAPPINAPNGKRWFDTTSGRTFILYNDVDSTQWVEESPSAAPVMVPSDRPVLCMDYIEDRNHMWKGYQPRDGQLLNRSDYPEAWSAIQAGLVPKCSDAIWLSDTTKRGCYTEGDGATTFRMPDYNGIHNGTTPVNPPMYSTGCWASKMFGALQTNLPLISIPQISNLEARVAVLEAKP